MNDNPQVPEASVASLDVARAKLRSTRQFNPTNGGEAVATEIPEETTFEIGLHTGPAISMAGYLVATSTFLGVANKEGLIQAVFPMDNVQYAIPANAPAAA